jgi:hypothetical protein
MDAGGVTVGGLQKADSRMLQVESSRQSNSLVKVLDMNRQRLAQQLSQGFIGGGFYEYSKIGTFIGGSAGAEGFLYKHP